LLWRNLPGQTSHLDPVCLILVPAVSFALWSKDLLNNEVLPDLPHLGLLLTNGDQFHLPWGLEQDQGPHAQENKEK